MTLVAALGQQGADADSKNSKIGGGDRLGCLGEERVDKMMKRRVIARLAVGRGFIGLVCLCLAYFRR